MNTTTLSALAIVGVAVSLFMQWLKNLPSMSNYRVQAIVIALSVICGGVYYFLQMHTNLLANILAILATADAAYAYIWQYFEKPAVTTGTGVPPS